MEKGSEKTTGQDFFLGKTRLIFVAHKCDQLFSNLTVLEKNYKVERHNYFFLFILLISSSENSTFPIKKRVY